MAHFSNMNLSISCGCTKQRAGGQGRSTTSSDSFCCGRLKWRSYNPQCLSCSTHAPLHKTLIASMDSDKIQVGKNNACIYGGGHVLSSLNSPLNSGGFLTYARHHVMCVVLSCLLGSDWRGLDSGPSVEKVNIIALHPVT